MKFIYFIAFMFLAFTACNDDPKSDPAPKVEAAIELTTDLTNVEVPTEGGEVVVSFTSTKDWQVTAIDPAEGVEITPASGKAGEATVTIQIPANDTKEVRVIICVIQSDDIEEVISIKQLYVKQEPTYSIGSFYQDGTTSGVVFYVDESRQHGLMVSLTEMSDTAWALESRVVGTTDEYDGEVNTELIKTCENWQELYPSFYWCTEQGDGWYMPSSEELYLLYEAYSLSDLNASIMAANGVALSANYYLSSTEYDAQRITSYDFSSGYGSRVMKDDTTNLLRAIRKF